MQHAWSHATQTNQHQTKEHNGKVITAGVKLPEVSLDHLFMSHLWIASTQCQDSSIINVYHQLFGQHTMIFYLKKNKKNLRTRVMFHKLGCSVQNNITTACSFAN